jgi:hypothetical protein
VTKAELSHCHDFITHDIDLLTKLTKFPRSVQKTKTKPEAQFVYDPVTNSSSIKYKNIKFEAEEPVEGKELSIPQFS